MNPPVVILRLPPPPSVNGLFKNVRGRGRAVTKRYKLWRVSAGWQLKMQKPEPISECWEADIGLPTGTRSDLDNMAKGILDLLVAHGVVSDDRHCTKLTIAKAKTTGDVIVTLRPAL